MRKFHFKIFIPGLLTILSSCKFTSPQHVQLFDGQGDGIKVLELFTSEGCSSCPPADALMIKLVSKNDPAVVVLTYHVDYWNKLGWKDTFSDPAFTERQNLYAAHFNNQSVYTPQLVINGKKEFTGSDEETLINQLRSKNLPGNPASLDAEIIKINKNHITFKYNLPATVNQVINFALVQENATTEVGRGENKGRSLKHVNIVRSLKTVELREETQQSEISFDITPVENRFFIIAFAQDKTSLNITHAIRLEIKQE